MRKIIAIAANSLVETVRQPVFVIILAGGAFMIALSPSFTMFTFMSNIKLVKDMGLATILLTGILQTVFAAAGVVSSEIENKTAMMILPKPVSKAQFICGKYFGIAAAIAGSVYLLTLILLLTVRVGVPEAAYTRLHKPVIFGEISAILIAVMIATLANYFHDRSFCSSCFGYSLISFTFIFLLLGFIDKDMKLQKFCTDVDPLLISAAYLILLALLTVTAVAIALSTRFGMVLSVVLCVSIFILGLLSDYIFGRFVDRSAAAKIAYSVIPNMQAFWVADAVITGQRIPLRFLASVTGYGAAYQMAVLALSVLLFETREIS